MLLLLHKREIIKDLVSKIILYNREENLQQNSTITLKDKDLLENGFPTKWQEEFQ